MVQADFATRWNDAEENQRLPDLVTATHWVGAVRGLETQGKLKMVVSERLSFLTNYASCPDFAGRFLWMVRGSEHPSRLGTRWS